MLTYNSEKLPELVSQLNDYLHRIEAIGLCQYGLVTDSGHISTDFTSACISGVSRLKHLDLNGGRGSPLVWVHTFNTNRKVPNKDVIKAWADWMQNESPWRFAFIFKDEFNYSSTNSVALRCDIGCNYMATAMNVMRLPAENYCFMEAWYKMVQKGVNPSAALLLCGYVPQVNSQGVGLIKRLQNISHSIFYKTDTGNMMDLLSGKSCINSFLYKDLYKDVKMYNGAWYYYQNGGPNAFYNLLTSKFHPVGKLNGNKDLMGRVVSKPCAVYSVEQINKCWEDLCTKYS